MADSKREHIAHDCAFCNFYGDPERWNLAKPVNDGKSESDRDSKPDTNGKPVDFSVAHRIAVADPDPEC